GFALGLVVATVLGALTGFSARVRQVLDPTLQALRAIPSIAWVPLFILWFGIFEASKVALIAAGAFFPVYLALMTGIQGVDRKLVEASWCLGVSRLGTFFRVIVPLSWPGILTGMVLTFAHTVGEFGVVLMVGGNIPGVTRTLSIAIYDDVQALNYEAAGQTALVLVAFSFAALCITYVLQRRVLL
ncbi:MAG TPA: ABC transporter permease subunit, partial [Pirellulaceae bacterium]|nr:ABC transporter permease subunit [Pirellulaceae bacterium]